MEAIDLTPKQIVERLDNYIIGQKNAKRSVAIALRNRSRRLKLSEDMRDEVAPKNILMIGPTGVGKTEIARRLAKLCGAPFIKVEATKYSEIGYVGRDVESMIRDLMAVGFKMVKSEMEDQMRGQAKEKVEERLLDLLLPGSGDKAAAPSGGGILGSIFGRKIVQQKNENGEVILLPDQSQDAQNEAPKNAAASQDMKETREKFRQMLREGKLESREVELTVTTGPKAASGIGIFSGGNMDDIESAMQSIQQMMAGNKKKQKTVTIAEARNILTEEILDNMLDADKCAEIAKERVEQSGIVFIDEIDKIAVHGETHGQSVSREGVQRDILPIVEGSHVNTRYGVVDTKHILFIAAGAFSLSKPSDLIPELQGRFPLRVELDSLHKEDFKRILLEPKNALVKQYKALLETEGVSVEFAPEAIDRMTTIAEEVNAKAENIGARRLHTIMEKVLEDISFEADEHKGQTITIDAAFVDEKLKDISSSEDLSRYIL
ncbi:MAG: ATP-dependent protease ATPase subunit HslU [Treponema sp.]|nr:ATP-dependent protease ATPase subunit HslU [Treponema sp.]MEE3434254.1 ATP-dependent protease ATPase subunit HslU [Treponema sp.]